MLVVDDDFSLPVEELSLFLVSLFDSLFDSLFESFFKSLFESLFESDDDEDFEPLSLFDSPFCPLRA